MSGTQFRSFLESTFPYPTSCYTHTHARTHARTRARARVRVLACVCWLVPGQPCGATVVEKATYIKATFLHMQSLYFYIIKYYCISSTSVRRSICVWRARVRACVRVYIGMCERACVCACACMCVWGEDRCVSVCACVWVCIRTRTRHVCRCFVLQQYRHLCYKSDIRPF